MKHAILNFIMVLAASALHSLFYFDTDKSFMIKAAQANIAEVYDAAFAIAQSTSDSIKAFAQIVIDDYTDAQGELAALAKNENVTLPDSTDAQHKMFEQHLMASINNFDSVYIQLQVQDHINAVALFTDEIRNGHDARTKAYASKLLPKLQMHLQYAQRLAATNTEEMSKYERSIR